MWWTAESNRNAEARSQPFELRSFYQFAPIDGEGESSGDRPPVEAGAAMMILLQRGELPPLVNPFYDDLAAALGSWEPEPLAGELLALVAENGEAVLLAPREGPRGWHGFLVWTDQSAGEELAFRSLPAGLAEARLSVPRPVRLGAVMAEEGAVLTIP